MPRRTGSRLLRTSSVTHSPPPSSTWDSPLKKRNCYWVTQTLRQPPASMTTSVISAESQLPTRPAPSLSDTPFVHPLYTQIISHITISKSFYYFPFSFSSHKSYIKTHDLSHFYKKKVRNFGFFSKLRTSSYMPVCSGILCGRFLLPSHLQRFRTPTVHHRISYRKLFSSKHFLYTLFMFSSAIDVI